MASKIEVEVEMKSNENKVWDSIKNSATFFPKALPELFENIEILEGDGASVGSLRLVKYRHGVTEIPATKEKIENLDDESRSLSYAVIDGDFLKFYKNYKASLTVIGGNSGGGSSVKWEAEFEKADDETPDPELIKGFAVKTFQDLDAYILANA